jgi:hypothetical protein
MVVCDPIEDCVENEGVVFIYTDLSQNMYARLQKELNAKGILHRQRIFGDVVALKPDPNNPFILELAKFYKPTLATIGVLSGTVFTSLLLFKV